MLTLNVADQILPISVTSYCPLSSSIDRFTMPKQVTLESRKQLSIQLFCHYLA